MKRGRDARISVQSPTSLAFRNIIEEGFVCSLKLSKLFNLVVTPRIADGGIGQFNENKVLCMYASIHRYNIGVKMQTMQTMQTTTTTPHFNNTVYHD